MSLEILWSHLANRPMKQAERRCHKGKCVICNSFDWDREVFIIDS